MGRCRARHVSTGMTHHTMSGSSCSRGSSDGNRHRRGGHTTTAGSTTDAHRPKQGSSGRPRGTSRACGGGARRHTLKVVPSTPGGGRRLGGVRVHVLPAIIVIGLGMLTVSTTTRRSMHRVGIVFRRLIKTSSTQFITTSILTTSTRHSTTSSTTCSHSLLRVVGGSVSGCFPLILVLINALGQQRSTSSVLLLLVMRGYRYSSR